MKTRRNFSSHPKRISSRVDSDASSPTSAAGYTLSTLDLNSLWDRQERQKTKENAEMMHKSLSEKLNKLNEEDPLKCVKEKFQDLDSSEHSESSIDRVDSPLFENYRPNRKNATNPSAISIISKRSNSRHSGAQNSLANRGIPCSIFDKKYKFICEKALQVINDIRCLLSKGKPSPDGDDDITRREIRVKEFANRFSRIYLYPLARELEDLQQRESPQVLPEPPMAVINQKMLSAYQYVYHGLQAYQSHLPTSTGDCCAPQLKVLLNRLVDLCEIHRKHVSIGDEKYLLEFIDTFKINAELTIQKTDQFLSLNPTEECAALKSETFEKKKKLQKKSFSADNRFAMYSTTAAFRKDVHWQRAVENLAKKKFNVKSKYRSASYKHRPPVQRQPQILFVRKFPFGTPSKKPLKNCPTEERLEENITTMVEVEESGGNYAQEENQEENAFDGGQTNDTEQLLIKLLQWTLKKNAANDDVPSDINDILKLAKNEDFLKKVLKSLSNEMDCNNAEENKQQLTFEVVKSQTSLIHDNESRPKKEPKISISGAKNARLICITEDDSVVEQLDTETKNCETDNECLKDQSKPNIIVKTCSKTQNDIKSHEVTAEAVLCKSTQRSVSNPISIKISRLKKTGRHLQQLQKKYAVNIIQYKLDFYKHCRDDPMYKKTLNNIQPPALMEKISEDILCDSLLEVAKEMKIHEMVEGVYKAELAL